MITSLIEEKHYGLHIQLLPAQIFKVIRLFCLKLKFSRHTEPIKFSFLDKLHLGPGMVLNFIYFQI